VAKVFTWWAQVHPLGILYLRFCASIIFHFHDPFENHMCQPYTFILRNSDLNFVRYMYEMEVVVIVVHRKPMVAGAHERDLIWAVPPHIDTLTTFIARHQPLRKFFLNNTEQAHVKVSDSVQ
jgi:hypothetical protein